MGVFVIYTVAYIIVSPCSQFFSYKSIGNVVLFALRTNHPDSLLNIFINPEYSEAFARMNPAAVGTPPPLRHVAHLRGAVPVLNTAFVRQTPSAWEMARQPRFVSYLIRNYYLESITSTGCDPWLQGAGWGEGGGREQRGLGGSRQHPVSVWGSSDDRGHQCVKWTTVPRGSCHGDPGLPVEEPVRPVGSMERGAQGTTSSVRLLFPGCPLALAGTHG